MSEKIKPDDESSGQNPLWPGEGPAKGAKPNTTQQTGETADGEKEKTYIPIVR